MTRGRSSATTGPGGQCWHQRRNSVLNGGMWKGDNVRPARRLAERISVIAAILANTGAGTRDWGSSVSSSLHLAPPVTFLNHMNYFQHTTKQRKIQRPKNGIECQNCQVKKKVFPFCLTIYSEHVYGLGEIVGDARMLDGCIRAKSVKPCSAPAVWQLAQPKYLLLWFPEQNFMSLTFQPIVSKQRTKLGLLFTGFNKFSLAFQHII